MPLGEAISSPLGLWHSLPGHPSYFNWVPFTLVWFRQLKSMTCVDALLHLLMLWNTVLGCPPCAEAFLALSGLPQSPHWATLGRFPAPHLGCQTLAQVTALPPFLILCGCISCLVPSVELALNCFKGKEEEQWGKTAFFFLSYVWYVSFPSEAQNISKKSSRTYYYTAPNYTLIYSHTI